MHRPTIRLVTFAAIHVATSALGLWAGRWYVWIAVWAVQALNLLTSVAVLHECTHLHYFRSRAANRVTGTAMAAIGFTCYESYRPQHLYHHAHTCAPGDPEGEPYAFTSRWQIVGAFAGGGLLYALLVLARGVGVAFGTTPDWLTNAREQRRRIRINVAILAALVGLVVALAVSGTVAFTTIAAVWLVPASVALLGPIPFVLMPEHYDAAGPGPAVTNTRTCTSNGLVRFVYLNTNLHTAHHDRPAVPWHRLPEHHAAIEADIEPEWVFPSYTAFHRFMWRTAGREPRSRLATDTLVEATPGIEPG